MPQLSPLFMLPNTSTLLARTAINLLKSADQLSLDEAIQTLINGKIAAPAVMPKLEQSVNFSEVLEKLAEDWTPETLKAFAAAFTMDSAKKNVMDLIVAIAILNEDDLESELRSENTPQATANDLLDHRKITWQYPPPGTVLNPPYVVLVAVEAVDTTAANSEIQSILGELVDYRGYKIARRPTTGPLRLPPGITERLMSQVVTQPPVVAQPPIVAQPPLAFTVPEVNRSLAEMAKPINAAGAAATLGAPVAPPAAGTAGTIGTAMKTLNRIGGLSPSSFSRVIGGF
jgi:hypothetical protein